MRPRLSWIAFGLVGCAVLAVVGCGDSGTVTPADPDRARDVLTKVLDSWKSGAAHVAPSQGNPPIRVADEDWIAGTKLVDFQLGARGDSLQMGEAVQLPVTLTTADARGKTAKRVIHYRVTTEPRASVIRED
jgi:hypothetical protein